MAKAKSTVQAPMGMIHSWWYPITAEPPAAHPTYGEKIDMGHAVKGVMSITTVTVEIPGDDEIQVASERFVSGQLDVETTMNDLDVNAKLFGHTYAEESGELSKSTDEPAMGGWAGVEPILQKDKSVVYRATILFRTKPIASSEKQEADTRKPSEGNPKNNAVSLKLFRDNSTAWRHRKEFPTLEEADAWIESIVHPSIIHSA